MSLSIQADPKLAQDASYHYSRAIYEVNKRIANSKHEEIPNATIFAVGCLVHAEVRSSLLPLCLRYVVMKALLDHKRFYRPFENTYGRFGSSS